MGRSGLKYLAGWLFKIGRISLHWLARLGLILLFGFFGLLLYLQTPQGRQTLADFAAELLSGPNVKVAVGQTRGVPPHSLVFENVTLSDKKGVWAKIDRVGLYLNPLALVDGMVEINGLRFGQVEILRQPVLAHNPNAKPFRIPDLPLAIRLKAFTVKNIRLDAAVAGKAAAMTAAGSGAWERHLIALNFKLDRTDAATDHIVATLNLVQNKDPLQSRLKADLNVAGKPGGILARLAGLKPKDGLVATLAGDGPLNGWSGHLKAHAEGLAALSGDIKIDDGGKDTSVGFNGKVNLAPVMSVQAIARLGSEVMVDAKAHLARGQSVGYDLKAHTQALALTLESAAEAQAKKRLWKISAKILDPAYFKQWLGNVTFRQASLSGVMEGELTSPALKLNLHFVSLAVPRLTMGEVSTALNLSLVKGPSGWSGKGKVAGSVASLAVETGAPPVQSAFEKASFSADGSFDSAKHILAFRSFGLQGSGIIASGSGKLSFADAPTAIKISATAADLGNFKKITGMTLKGSLAVEANLTRRNGAAPLQISGLAHTKNFWGGGDFIAALLGPEISASFDGAQDSAQGGFSGKAQITGKMVEAGLEGKSVRGALEAARYHMSVTDTAALNELAGVPLPPSLRVDGEAQGSFSDLSTEGRLTAADLIRKRLKFTGINGQFSLKNLGSAPNGRVSFAMNSPTGALHASANLATPKGSILRVENIKITAPGTIVGGEFALKSGMPATGRLSGVAKDLKTLAKQFDIDAEGSAEFSLSLKDRGGRQYIEASARGAKLLTVLSNHDILKMDGMTLTASGDYDGALHDLDIDLALNNIRGATAQISAFRLKAGGQGQTAHYNMALAGNFRGKVKLAAAGSFTDRSDGYKLTVDTLDGELYGRLVKLAKPFVVNQELAGLTADPLDLTLGNGHLKGSWRQDVNGLRVDGEAQNFDLILLSLLYPEAPINGAGDATVKIRVADGLPAGKITLALRKVTSALPGRAVAEPLQANLTATFGRKALNFNGQLVSPDKLQVSFDGKLPLKINPLKQTLSVAEDAPLQAKLDWKGDVAPLWNLMPPSDHRVSGNLDGHLQVAGTFANPALRGTATLANAAYDSRSLGLAARDVGAELKIAGRRVTVVSATGNDAGGGTFKAAGWLDLIPQAHFPASFDLTLNKARVIRITDLKAAVSAALGYTREADHSTLSGNANVQKLEGQIVKHLPLEVPEIEVKEINLPPSEMGGLTTRTVGARKVQPYPTHLDVHVKAAKGIFVRGRGLDSEWKGEVDVEGSVDKPIISGDMTVVRGTFTLAGKEFTLTEGTLTFVGGDKVDPVINIKAEYKVTDLTATLQLTGKSSKPKVTLTSTPDLPQEEILSRILFGTAVAQLGPLEAVQLAGAVASLSGSGGSLDLMNFARSRLGLDRLRFEAAADRTAGTLISGGKFITNNIYLEVETATGNGQSKASVKVNITDNLSVESDVGSGNTSGVGIKWQKDY